MVRSRGTWRSTPSARSPCGSSSARPAPAARFCAICMALCHCASTALAAEPPAHCPLDSGHNPFEMVDSKNCSAYLLRSGVGFMPAAYDTTLALRFALKYIEANVSARGQPST
jgi:hypothetical protein